MVERLAALLAAYSAGKRVVMSVIWSVLVKE